MPCCRKCLTYPWVVSKSATVIKLSGPPKRWCGRCLTCPWVISKCAPVIHSCLPTRCCRCCLTYPWVVSKCTIAMHYSDLPERCCRWCLIYPWVVPKSALVTHSLDSKGGAVRRSTYPWVVSKWAPVSQSGLPERRCRKCPRWSHRELLYVKVMMMLWQVWDIVLMNVNRCCKGGVLLQV